MIAFIGVGSLEIRRELVMSNSRSSDYYDIVVITVVIVTNNIVIGVTTLLSFIFDCSFVFSGRIAESSMDAAA